MKPTGNAKKLDDLFARASASHRAGRLKEAEQLYAELLRAQPNHLGALNLRGILLAQIGRYEGAESSLRQALSINPLSEATLCNYANVLQKLNKPVEALHCFDQALARISADPYVWNSRGALLNDLRRFEEALKDFEKAIALMPEFAEAFYNRGNSLYGLRRFEEAVASYQKWIAINSTNVGPERARSGSVGAIV